MLVVGEAGIGKTRLANEFVTWTRAQGAEVLRGHAFEMGGRLPYQPLVEALRARLEAENAPEDLLEDVWLSELSRLLPELRVRYPDLETPTDDELTAKGRLFEAVARLLDALCQRAPLVLLVDDLQWVDEASMDLLRYLGYSWKEQGSRVLLLGMVRREGLELNPQLSAQLASLERDLPVTQMPLQTLSQTETLQLIQSLVGESEHGTVRSSTTGPGASPSQVQETPLVVLGDFLFAQTGGQPLYLLETLKLLREREWLVPQRGADGTWRLEPTVDLSEAIRQERSRREMLPPSVRALILARLSKLHQLYAPKLIMRPERVTEEQLDSCLAQTDCRYDEAHQRECGPVPENGAPHLRGGARNRYGDDYVSRPVARCARATQCDWHRDHRQAYRSGRDAPSTQSTCCVRAVNPAPYGS
jgi:hypothetical protein